MLKLSPPVRFGIIGTGGIAKAHARALKADARVRCVGVTDPVPGKAATFLAENGFDREFADASAMLASPEIDAVTVCTPPRLHAPLILEALATGKAILSEKPVVLSMRELEECLAAEKKTGGTVGCIFQWRYGRGLRMLHQLQKEGLTGKLLWCNLHVHWFRTGEYYAVPWRGKWANESGGVSVAQSIHGIDAMLTVTGLPTKITAQIATLNHNIEVEDYSAALLEFAGGARGTMQCNVDCRKERSHMIFGFEKITALSNHSPYSTSDLPWTFRAAEKTEGDPLRGGAKISAADELQHKVDAIYAGWENTPTRADHGTQIGDFVTALVEGKRPAIGLEDCRLSTQYLSAMYKSARTGQTITLPIQPGDAHWDTWNGVA